MSQPYLVTQVFIGGHLVAIEKSSYADVLDRKLDQEARNEQIRSRMQDQHKRLLKNLVKQEYDDKIALYLDGPSKLNGASVPAPVLAEAESIPRAETNPVAPVKEPSGDIVLEAKTLPVADEVPDQVRSPVSGILEPLAPLIQDLAAPTFTEDSIDDADLFKVFDEELQKQVPWSPSNQIGSLPPLDPELFDGADLADTMPPEPAPRSPSKASPAPPRRPPKAPPASEVARPTSPDRTSPDRTSPDRTLRPAGNTKPPDRRPRPPPEVPTEVGRTPPPVSDTLIDFGLPAALKEQLGQAKAALEQARKKAQDVGPPTSSRKSDPRVARFRMPRSPSPTPGRERETQIDLALRRRASSSRTGRPINGDAADAETLLDVDAGEIQEYIARKKKERSEKSPPAKAPAKKKKDASWGDAVDETAPGAPADADSKRPNILVVERSLDEVILSYLADED